MREHNRIEDGKPKIPDSLPIMRHVTLAGFPSVGIQARDNLDFAAADTVANTGEGKSRKAGITVDEPTAAVLAERVAARWRARGTAAGPARRSRPLPNYRQQPPALPRTTPWGGAGRVSVEDPGDDHAAAWSSPSSARIVARTRSRGGVRLGPRGSRAGPTTAAASSRSNRGVTGLASSG